VRAGLTVIGDDGAMQVLAIASTGLDAAFQRFEQSAQRTARVASPYADVDLAQEAVEQISARASFSANIAVMRTANQMLGQLLDILA
jgi:flagellar basal body rod protein FlgC